MANDRPLAFIENNAPRVEKAENRKQKTITGIILAFQRFQFQLSDLVWTFPSSFARKIAQKVCD